jgi:hypothetical protein
MTYDDFCDLYRARFGRESVCAHREMDHILQRTDNPDAILAAMLGRVGTPSYEERARG